MTPKPAKPIRAALYVRCSTGHQDIGLQEDELKQVAEQRGWDVHDIYIDEGFSGTTADRPALERMMTDARRGKFDLLVVWKLDRLGRSLQHLLAILDELTSLGVGFVSVRDAGITTESASGKLMISLIGAFSAYEHAMIRERCMAGLQRAKDKGIVLGRPRREIDLRGALALLDRGHGLKSAAKILGIPKTTLRERLIEAGEWPRKPGSENPPDRST